ncbi:MAG: hypothetical protein ACW960_15930 [Candidatus Thorarchaeota archaeon]
MSVYILDYNNCFFYYPWPKYLDEEQHKWMDDYDFMVTEVLKNIKARTAKLRYNLV